MAAPSPQFDRNTKNLIACFRGLPTDTTRSTPKDALALKGLLDGVFLKYKIGVASIEETIMANWKYVVGDRNAHRCSPQRIVGGTTLVVFTANAGLVHGRRVCVSL